MLAVGDLRGLEDRVGTRGREVVQCCVAITAFVGMAGGLHLFTATNWAWRGREVGGELSKLDVGSALQSSQESDGFDGGKIRARMLRISRSNYGTKFGTRSSKVGMFDVRVSTPGELCFAVAAAGSCCTDAPSCIFVGPIETAEKARLEALYQQARDSYYSGQPLVVDDMFDKVEMQLRWHGSKLVLKYPRCSLKRFTAYADAELDPSQMRALATVWSLLFALGLGLAVGLPTLVAHYDPGSTFVLSDSNRTLFSVVSFLVGAPVAQAAVKQLQALGRGDLVALKGCCPNCGGEVYTFVEPDYSSLKVRHESECHVCERLLVFQATLHPSKSGLGQPWAHGRVYLPTRAHQLAPARPSP